MYGFPLTIYLLSGWLQARYPGMDLMSHDTGHLWSTLFGLSGNPHFSALHITSDVLIFGGFILLSAAWNVLYQAQHRRELATTGAYAYVRHPQYVGFIVIMLGFLLQWPTILTVAMFPILVVMYWRLARAEEREAIASFGDAYREYMKRVPAFLPHLGSAEAEDETWSDIEGREWPSTYPSAVDSMRFHLAEAKSICKQGKGHEALLHPDVVRAFLNLPEIQHPTATRYLFKSG